MTMVGISFDIIIDLAEKTFDAVIDGKMRVRIVRKDTWGRQRLICEISMIGF